MDIRNFILLLLGIIGFYHGQCQNLIPNGDFEDYTVCPNDMNQVLKAKHWTPYIGTPDFFNSCNMGPSGVPQNDVGNQTAYSGRGYGGVVTKERNSAYSEGLQSPLVSKLDSGKLYYFEIFVSKGDVNVLDDNTLGICLSSDATLNKKTIYPSNTYFKDKNGWTKFSFYFTAKGYEQMITIGSFPPSGGPYTNDDHLDTTSLDICYYYIDKLYLGDCPLGKLKPNLLGNDTTICSDSLLNFKISAQVPYNNQRYSWSTGDTTAEITIKTIGKYLVTISNYSCTYTDTIEVKRTPFPKVNLGPDQTVCEEAAIKLTALNANASRYKWNDTSYFSTLTTKDSGIFWVDVTVKGCTTRDSVYLSRLPLPRFSLGNDSIICFSKSFTLQPDHDTDQTSYLWSTLDTTRNIQALNSGLFWLQTKRLGCLYRDSIHLYINGLKPFSLGNDTFFCDTQIFTLSANSSGSKTYLWNTDDSLSIISIHQTGLYWVKVADSTCVQYDSIFIDYRPSPIIDLGEDTIVCSNTLYRFDAGNPGATYLWSNGSTNRTLVATQFGKYGVQVTKNSCSTSDSMFLSFESPPVFELGPDTVMCKGDTFNINAYIPGSSYQWDIGWNQAIFPATYSDLFKVSVTRNHCVVRDSMRVTFFNKPKFDLGNDTLICTNKPVELGSTIPFGYAYNWQDGSTSRTYQTTTSGTYWVRLNNNGCFKSDSIHLLTFHPPVVELGNDSIVCAGTEVQLTAGTATATVLWSNGESLHNVKLIVPFKVSVNVKETTGCEASDEITIDTFTTVIFSLGVDTTICDDQFFTLKAPTSHHEFAWNTGESTPQIKPSKAGIYSLSARDLNGCKSTDDIAISTFLAPNFNMPDTLSNCENNIVLQGPIGMVSYLWNDGSTTDELKIVDYGIYHLAVTDVHNCNYLKTTVIKNECPPIVYIPNAFTVDNNGINDHFLPVFRQIKSFEMAIYNRWGEEVFRTSSFTNGWDGMIGNRPAPSDVYFYNLIYFTYHNEVGEMKGNVTLLR